MDKKKRIFFFIKNNTKNKNNKDFEIISRKLLILQIIIVSIV